MLTHIRDCDCFQGAQDSSACGSGGNKARYCETLYDTCATDTHQDKHTRVLMIHFAKLSLHLSAFTSPSPLPAAASRLLSQPKSVKQLYGAPARWRLASKPTFFRSELCFVCVCLNVCVTEKERKRGRNERVSVRKREGEGRETR